MTTDPTYEDMRTHLLTIIDDDDTMWELEEAIYWYAHDYHGGQMTDLYKATCISPFRPGAYCTGLSDGEALDLYMELQQKFGGA